MLWILLAAFNLMWAVLAADMARSRDRSMVLWGLAALVLSFVSPLGLLWFGDSEAKAQALADAKIQAMYEEQG